jgi:hypothetical protein
VVRLPGSPVGWMWKENVKLDLADTKGESVDWINLAQDRVLLRALVSHAVHYASRNFSCMPVSRLDSGRPYLVTRNPKLHATTPRGSQAQTETAHIHQVSRSSSSAAHLQTDCVPRVRGRMGASSSYCSAYVVEWGRQAATARHEKHWPTSTA